MEILIILIWGCGPRGNYKTISGQLVLAGQLVSVGQLVLAGLVVLADL